MMDISNLTGSELTKFINNQFEQILANNPEKFEDYFLKLYSQKKAIVTNIFSKYLKNDGFILKYPDIVVNLATIIIRDQKNCRFLLDIPKEFFLEYRDHYLELLKTSLDTCSNVYTLRSFLKDLVKVNNERYFFALYKLLTEKSLEYIDASHIFANIDNILKLKTINEHWDEYVAMYYERIIHSLQDIDSLKDFLCKKIYNVSFKDMKKRYYQYFISNRTNDINNKIIYFEQLLKASSKDEIELIYQETISFNRELHSVYDEIAVNIDKDSKQSFSEISKYKPLETSNFDSIYGVNIFDISEERFNLIIHNVSAGLSLNHKGFSSEFNYDFSTWERMDINGSITISASTISNKYLGHVTRGKQGNQELFFAFSNIPAEEIFFSGVHDMGINTRTTDYEKLFPSDGFGQHYLADQILKHSFIDYNEVLINRFLDKTKTQKRLPDYIVCFDEINELSLEYARYFSIPILFINTKKCAYKNIEEIKSNLMSSTINNLLDNINEFFAFICGLKYSDVAFELVKYADWNNIIIDAIKNCITQINDIEQAKKLLIIIEYIEENIPEYLDGLTSKFNISNDFNELAVNFNTLSSKIVIMKQVLNNMILNMTDDLNRGLIQI